MTNVKKIMLIGPRNSGKTTLIQALKNEPKVYRKTQTIEFIDCFVDTPGEYLQIPKLYHALITSATEVEIIGVVFDADSKDFSFPPGFFATLNNRVVGIINKIDLLDADQDYAERALRFAGVKGPIVKVSALTGKGIKKLKEILNINN
jgi:ethanolamine utilization protein EutP